jgi:polysaccharide export outer membrane protein
VGDSDAMKRIQSTNARRGRAAGIAVIAACAMCLVLPLCRGQIADNLLEGRGSQAPATRALTASPQGSDYVIGADDVLAVNVWKESEISREMPVRPDGKISLPLVGDVQAGGLTAQQLQQSIRDRLASYLVNPTVTVMVREARSRRFNVVGEVQHPGSYVLGQPLTVLDALAVAGGFRDFAKTGGIYVLRVHANGSHERIGFNYKQVISGRNLAQNIHLQPGDTVVVP